MTPILFLTLVCLVSQCIGAPRPRSDLPPLPWPYNNTLAIGELLKPGDSLSSKNAVLTFVNGNVALTRKTPSRVVFQTGTNGSCASSFGLQSDGDLALIACNGTKLWSAGTGGSGAEIAVIMDDCTLSVFQEAPTTNFLWSSNDAMCLEVHLVPHSHDDVGWLITPEEYYNGCDPTNGPGRGVRGIINSVVDALLANSSRKYIQVEMYYFYQWWIEQPELRKNQTRALVASGQLEFINAGWSMHDEACVHYVSGIHNMAVGAEFIMKELNATNTIGWHIDPFGHASATPRLMAQMGFNGFFFERQDYQQRAYQVRTRTLERVWRPSRSLGASVEMFTSPMLSYGAGCDDAGCPSSFCCMSCMVGDSKTSIKNHTIRRFNSLHLPFTEKFEEGKQYTLRDVAHRFVRNCVAYGRSFLSNYIMMPWGSDFEHENAVEDFAFMDGLINEINNADLGVKIIYSTPSLYIKALHDLQYRWPVNYYDYFLDSDNGHAYWSGYLTSRAAYKGYERELNVRYLSSFYLLQGTVPNPQNYHRFLDVMRQALGVAQHHDSITGTEREAVRNRYQLLLANGTEAAMFAMSELVGGLTDEVGITFCPLSNISICAAAGRLDTFKYLPVILYNGIAQQREDVVMIPVPHANVTVVDSKGNAVPNQVMAAWQMSLTPDNTSPQTGPQLPYMVFFRANVSALGIAKYTVAVTPSSQLIEATTVKSTEQPIILENNVYRVTIDPVNGGITSVTNKFTNETTGLTQNYYYYCPNDGTDMYQQASGAYIFRPCVANEKPLPFTNAFQTKIVRGPVFDEVQQVVDTGSNIHQVVRLEHGFAPFVYLEFGMGEINAAPVGKEIVMRVDSEVNSTDVWYTDSQGLEVERRVRDQRPDYDYTPTEPVSGNFFPTYSFTYLVDSNGNTNRNMVVVGDRARAAASLSSGSLEMLVHRRLLHDDGRGVGEPLNENTRIISRNYFIINDPRMNVTTRETALFTNARPIVMFGKPTNEQNTVTKAVRDVSIKPLPRNVHLLSREYVNHKNPQSYDEFIVRVQHLYAIDDDATYSQPVDVTLDDLFSTRKIQSVVEMDLNGVRTLDSVNRYTWMTYGGPIKARGGAPLKGNVVTLEPMEIRTFLVQVQ
eukprot:PhF_6_TR13441/c0_g1_i1/m.21474/K12311/MAN2B1, LAMAN; lysosomal alpha-mannosidase